MNKYFLFIITNIILSGCINANPEKIASNDQCDENFEYCINFGNLMNNRKWTDNWSGLSGYTTDHTISNGFDANDSEYQRVDFSSKIDSCAHSIIGVSNPILEQETDKDYYMWGEVDEKNDGSFPDPNCRVKSIYPEKNPYEHMTAYAFCAQKGEKMVLVCVTQATKNQNQAEEIFSTFRWTDE